MFPGQQWPVFFLCQVLCSHRFLGDDTVQCERLLLHPSGEPATPVPSPSCDVQHFDNLVDRRATRSLLQTRSSTLNAPAGSETNGATVSDRSDVVAAVARDAPIDANNSEGSGSASAAGIESYDATASVVADIASAMVIGGEGNSSSADPNSTRVETYADHRTDATLLMQLLDRLRRVDKRLRTGIDAEGLVFLHVGAMAIVVLVGLALVGMASYRFLFDNDPDEDADHFKRRDTVDKFCRSPVFPARNIPKPLSSRGLANGRLEREQPIATRHPELEQPMMTSPAMSSRAPGHANYLCPGLVVPQGNECYLAVPTLAAMGLPLKESAVFDVADLQGQPVVRVEVAPPDWSGNTHSQHLVVLRTVSASAELLAYCEVGRASEGRSVRVFSARGELFGSVTRDVSRPRYLLTGGPQNNLTVAFEGNFAFATVIITDDNNRQRLADTEPCRADFDASKAYYKLRVSSCVDVCIVLCGLFAIDHMEGG